MIYLKCLYYNKVLSLGYITMFIGIFSHADFFIHYSLCLIGLLLAGVCTLGRDTISTYRRCKTAHLAGHKPEMNSVHYCNKAGYRWYKQEFKIK